MSSGTHIGKAAAAADARPGSRCLVYFGTYTGPKSKGIYLSRLDSGSGALTVPALAAETANPSFLALRPDGRYLYAVGEIGSFAGQKTGAVSAFAVERDTGALTLLNQAASGGTGPCHLVVDRTGRLVLVANYGGGSVAALPILADGRLGQATSIRQHTGTSVNPQRQEAPHAHSINVAPDNRFALAADLGLDKVLVYRLDPDAGALVPNAPPAATVKPGAGPRHLAFHPSGRFAYVINELDNTVTVFRYDAGAGTLTETQAIGTLPAGTTVQSYTAEVQVHPSGRFLYGSNRGHESLAVFAIDAESGRLALVECQPTGGKWPRHFGIDPTGCYLLAANERSDSVVVFRIHAESGRLEPTGQTIEVPAPVCVKFLPLP